MALNCVYLALIASTVVLGFVEPTAGGFCDGKHNGDYNDHNNCYGFITCSNGIAYKRDCPDHLKFDQATDRCEYNVDCFPVDGGWSDWSPWYPCSVSCGGGKQLKFRTCTNPRPSHGGKYCVGPNKLSRVCNRQPCPGGFCYGKPNGDYSDPDNCYGFITCSNGIAYKRDCPDHLKFNQTTDRCEHNVDCFPVDGGWSDWSPWYPCSVSCGGGKQLKFRTCTNPRPSHGGKYCVGPNKLSRVCNRQTCPFFCRHKRNGDYTDPENPHGFITCSNGLTYHRECPANLIFNERKDECDWPPNVDG